MLSIEEQTLENYGTQKWLNGHYGGLDQCCRWLEARATVLFSERKHEKALELQRLADEMKAELRPVMVKAAEEHERDFPSKIG